MHMVIARSTFKEKIEEAIRKNEMIVFACKCMVWYSGRAEAFLPTGDRIILIKPDNTVLIHQPEGGNPINYLKGGASVSLSIMPDSLFMNCVHLAQKEYLDIKIAEVYYLQNRLMEDGRKQELAGTEADMADMLYKNPQLICKGFTAVSKEEQTKYGFIDVFGYDPDGNLIIVECKRYTADLSAVSQLRRYVEKIKKSKGVDNVRGFLAAPKITANALRMLENWGFTHVAVKPPKHLERYSKYQKKLGDF